MVFQVWRQHHLMVGERTLKRRLPTRSLPSIPRLEFKPLDFGCQRSGNPNFNLKVKYVEAKLPGCNLPSQAKINLSTHNIGGGRGDESRKKHSITMSQHVREQKYGIVHNSMQSQR